MKTGRSNRGRKSPRKGWTLPAVCFRQANKQLILTTVTAKQLLTWYEAKVIVAEQWKKDANTGYQRILNQQRVNKIANFVLGRGPAARARKIILPLLPQSVLLSARRGSPPPKIIRGNCVWIDPKARLAQVDGQHRIAGLLKAIEIAGTEDSSLKQRILKYRLPVGILTSLSLAQEAAQFLTINKTQKKVKPDLELRVIYHRNPTQADQLVRALSLEAWTIKGLAVTIGLNDTKNSPWMNAISRPGEKERKGISEGQFVDFLRPVCDPRSTLGRKDASFISATLRRYWNVIRKACPEAWEAEGRSRYLLRRTLGVGAYHYLAALAYEVAAALALEFGGDQIRSLLGRALPRGRDWRPGGKHKGMAGKAVTYDLADKLSKKIVEGYEPYKRVKRRLENFASVHSQEKNLRKAMRLLSPLSLRSFDQDSIKANASPEAGGAYVLIKLRRSTRSFRVNKIYVGRSETNLVSRLMQHWNKADWDLFSAIPARSASDCTALESFLFHLTDPELRSNREDPKNCVYCNL